jgi:hypothetical protein
LKYVNITSIFNHLLESKGSKRKTPLPPFLR